MLTVPILDANCAKVGLSVSLGLHGLGLEFGLLATVAGCHDILDLHLSHRDSLQKSGFQMLEIGAKQWIEVTAARM